MFAETIFALAALAAPTMGLSGMATTTRYYDGQEGACGCGTSSGLFSWQSGLGNEIYTAAGSQALFDPSGSSWCGSGCGQCYELTSTGSAPPGQGAGGTAGESIIVMVTNLCPNAGNAQWCPAPGSENQYGYEYHFDLMAADSSLPQIIGDNPVVNFTSIECPAVAASDFGQCQCKASSTGVAGSGPSSTASSPATSSTAAAGSGSGSSSAAPAPSPSPSEPASGPGSESSTTASQFAQPSPTDEPGEPDEPDECEA